MGIAQYLQTIYPELLVRVMNYWSDVEQWMRINGTPKVLVADVTLTNNNNLAALAQWRGQGGTAPWLAISGDGNPSLPQQVRSAGAQGFVHKQARPEVFGRAFSAVMAGQEYFEPLPRTWG